MAMIEKLLDKMLKNNASDLHIATGSPPIYRIDGELQPISDHKALTLAESQKVLEHLLNKLQLKHFQENMETDFSYSLKNKARFRVNAYQQSDGISLAFRLVPIAPPTLDELEFPSIIKDLCDLPNGLVLVTGPTGSGKSTTLASMVNHINENHAKHILTIEDPIEFLHKNKRCLINQREVEQHTHNFKNALRAALREDPDIILVGELRDLDSIRLALTAAETGHLVLATLHTSSASKTINRVIDVFPGSEKPMIRSMLSESLQAVIAQRLFKRRAGGRIAAQEIMCCIPAIRNLIREDKVPQIYTAMETGRQYGMQTMANHVNHLIDQEIIDRPAGY